MVVSSRLTGVKVLTNAPQTIVMARRIKTLHIFTTTNLLATLQKRNCVECGEPCMFVDMFRLTRVCLSVDGLCDKVPISISLGHLNRIYPNANLSKSFFEGVPSFRVIEGTYRSSRWVRNRMSTKEVMMPNRLRYGSEAAYARIVQKELSKNPDAVVPNHLSNVPIRGRRAARTRVYNSSPCVVAP